jgi:hypothetical protein
MAYCRTSGVVNEPSASLPAFKALSPNEVTLPLTPMPALLDERQIAIEKQTV